MNGISAAAVSSIHALIGATRENLDRIESLLSIPKLESVDELDPKSPLNKTGQFLTPRGIEVCYRLFDIGKSRHYVSSAMDISYGAATHRFHNWEKLGGKDRERQGLD